MLRSLAHLLTALLLALVAPPVSAQDWQRHDLGDYGFAVPADWAETARRTDEIDFESPDGRYVLWARLWFPDEPLLGYDDIVTHGELTIGGQNALFVHREFPAERFLQYAFDPKDSKGRQFLFQLIGRDAPLAEHQDLFQRLGGQLVIDGVPAVSGQGAAAPETTAQRAAATPAADPAPVAGGELLALARARYGADCAPVDLAGWRHDTKPVLRDHGVTLRALALCHDKTWPVFGVDLPYDPRLGGNDGFFLGFYDALFRANGEWDFSLADQGFGALVEIRGRGRDGLTIDLHDLPAR